MNPICVMNRQNITSNGKLLVVSIESENTLRIKAYCVNYKYRKLSFFCSFTWSGKVKVDLIAVSELLEDGTCHRIPVALVAMNDTNGASHCYLLYINLNSRKCVALRKFSVLRKIIGSSSSRLNSNLMIVDGPSVLLLRKSHLYIYGSEEEITLSRAKFDPLQSCKVCRQLMSSAKILQCKCLFKSKIIFIAVTTKDSCSSCLRPSGQSLIVLDIKAGNFSELDSKCFIPEEFHDSLNCVHACDINMEKQPVIASQIYASTKNGFVILVQNGQLMKCISLCDSTSQQLLTDCTLDIQVSFIESVGKYYVVAKQEQEYTIFDQDLQVQKVYSAINQHFQGDFICNGTIQCLFVKSQNIETSEWILDDLNQFCINSADTGTSSVNEDEDDRTNTATKALQCRLQQEQAILQYNAQSLYKKKEFLGEMVINQLQSAAGCCPRDMKPEVDLVTLIEGEDVDTTDTLKTEGSYPKSSIEVCGTWQKTYNNKWSIGVEFYWKSQYSAEIWLQVIPSKETRIQMCTESKSVLSGPQTASNDDCLSSPPLQSEPKRLKIDKATCNVLEDMSSLIAASKSEPVMYTVSCVMDMPQFIQKSISVGLLLKWRLFAGPKNTEGNKNDSVVTEKCDSFKENHVLTLNCGCMVLNSEDVITGKLGLPITMEHNVEDSTHCTVEDFKDMQRNKLAWKIIQTCTDLIIRSSPGVLAQLEHLLEKRCGFKLDHRFHCYTTDVGILNKVQIELPPSMSDGTRELRIFAGSEGDLFLLLHHLYRCLPDNVVILPASKSRKHLPNILSEIQKETHFFSQGIRKLLDDHDGKTSAAEEGNEDLNKKNEDVRKLGETFKRKREEFIQQENKTMDVANLETFLDELSLRQQKTDLAIVFDSS